MERGYRKNSLVIDFSVLPAKPSVPMVRKFVFECLKLELSQIQNLQLSLSKSQVFLETKTPALAEELVADCNRKFHITVDGKEHLIPLFTPDGAVDVKVKDLPPYMPNALIAKHLLPYGEVLSIKDDIWHDYFPGVGNGTRIVRMRIKKAIPSYIKMEDETAFIRYPNQTPTCRYCARNLHIGTKCSDVKKALASSVNARLTLADIVQGVNPEMPVNTQQHNPSLTSMPTLVPAPLTDNCDEPGPSYIITSEPRSEQTNPTPITPENIHFEISDSEESNKAMSVDPANETSCIPEQQTSAESTDGYNAEQEERHELTSKRPASPKLADKKSKRQSRSHSKK